MKLKNVSIYFAIGLTAIVSLVAVCFGTLYGVGWLILLCFPKIEFHPIEVGFVVIMLLLAVVMLCFLGKSIRDLAHK